MKYSKVYEPRISEYDKNGDVYVHACERLVLKDFNSGKMMKITT